MRRASQSRFRIKTPGGEEQTVKKAESPGAVLSKALNLACKGESGVWEVYEWEDLLYRVHSLPGEKLDVRVEITSGTANGRGKH